MLAHSAIALLRDESTLCEGDVPHDLASAVHRTPTFAISRDAFLLKLPSGLAFHYQAGRGVTVARQAHHSDAEVELFLHGSVYGAIAWINGYVPLHASAVVHEGRVHAFTGISGAGKSTLAAALGARGLPLLSDDVLVLDLSDPDVITCLPGHKRIKLWGDAIALTQTRPIEAVRPDMDKFFAEPPGGIVTEPLPLARLYFLEEGVDAPALTAIEGVARFRRTPSAYYRPKLCRAITARSDRFALTMRIAGQVPLFALARPRDKAIFDDVADFVAGAIRSSSD